MATTNGGGNSNNQRGRCTPFQFQQFVIGVDALFSQWTALQLVGAHHDGSSVTELRNSTLGIFDEHGEVYEDELEDFFFDFFEQSRFCSIEDDSPNEAARLLCQMYRQCGNNDDTLIKRFCQAVPAYQQSGVVNQSQGQEVHFQPTAGHEAPQEWAPTEEEVIQEHGGDASVTGFGFGNNNNNGGGGFGFGGQQQQQNGFGFGGGGGEGDEIGGNNNNNNNGFQKQPQGGGGQGGFVFAGGMEAHQQNNNNQQQQSGPFVAPPMTVFGLPAPQEEAEKPKKQGSNNQPKKKNAFVKGNDGWNTVVGRRK